MKVLVTGAGGFIGTHLLKLIEKTAVSVSLYNPGWEKKIAKYRPSFVVHLAGITHSKGSKEDIRKVNFGGTEALAKKAILTKVKKFIMVSSIQAVAEKTKKGEKVNIDTYASPKNIYGKTKFEAEQLLRRLSLKSEMEVVIIRPPLVYGPKVKANFRNLFKLVDKEIPLPIAALDSNQRSFVSVSNLVDLILLCLEHPGAANKTFHVSDDDDISTAELLRRMGKALGKPARNLPIPAPMLKAGLRLAGKGEWVDKLFGDLRVDIEHTKKTLGWKPKVTMDEELERTAKWWRSQARD